MTWAPRIARAGAGPDGAEQAERCGRRATLRDRAGFTLTELLIVTVIIGLLALIVVPQANRFREKAMVSATKADLRYAMQAVETYVTVEAEWPSDVEDLAQAGYEPSPDVEFCTFELEEGEALEETHVVMEAAHRGSSTKVTTHYPTWGGELRESELGASECGSGKGKGKGKKGK